MANSVVITDSAADVPRAEAEEYGIRVMPIPITVDGTTYREGVDFTSEEYYPMLLGASTIPTTRVWRMASRRMTAARAAVTMGPRA